MRTSCGPVGGASRAGRPGWGPAAGGSRSRPYGEFGVAHDHRARRGAEPRSLWGRRHRVGRLGSAWMVEATGRRPSSRCAGSQRTGVVVALLSLPALLALVAGCTGATEPDARGPVSATPTATRSGTRPHPTRPRPRRRSPPCRASLRSRSHGTGPPYQGTSRPRPRRWSPRSTPAVPSRFPGGRRCRCGWTAPGRGTSPRAAGAR